MTDEIDYTILNQELDAVKFQVFRHKTSSAFLGALMCSLDIHWDEDIDTACTNGLFIKWNPTFFKSLDKPTRLAVMLHELFHVAYMHMKFVGKKDPQIWNYATDYVINNDLIKEGYTFNTDHLYDPKYDNMSANQVYEILIKDPLSLPLMPMEDIIIDDDVIEEVVNKVTTAINVAKMTSTDPGSIPGNIEETIKAVAQSKIPWEGLLFQWFTELDKSDFTWSRPNRRYSDTYLPSMSGNNGLTHLCYFLDVSGSVSDEQIAIFNSEVKYIKDTFSPEKLSLILFDTKIQKEYVIEQDDAFEEVKVSGRGGTCVKCVHSYIEKHKPSAAIIFSDMWFHPMEKLTVPVPLLWVAIDNPSFTTNQGTVIHITEK